MSLYSIFLATHSLMRWVVLLLLLWAMFRAWRGWLAKREWTKADRRSGLFLTIGMDIQFTLGLILYLALSPITRAAFSDFAAAMADADLRFFAVEHMALMVAAVAFAHIGNSLAKRDLPARDKFRRAAIWFTLSGLAVLAGIPWFRPLLPF